jgi:hypothetical protein
MSARQPGGAPPRFAPGTTLLDAVCLSPAAEAVLRARGEAVGVCLLCRELFETLQDVAARHGFDLAELLAELEAAARAADAPAPPGSSPPA